MVNESGGGCDCDCGGGGGECDEDRLVWDEIGGDNPGDEDTDGDRPNFGLDDDDDEGGGGGGGGNPKEDNGGVGDDIVNDGDESNNLLNGSRDNWLSSS